MWLLDAGLVYVQFPYIDWLIALKCTLQSKPFQEDANRGKPNWEHLADDLHVLLTVEDTENRAKVKLARAVDEVKRLLIPVSKT